MSHDDKIPSDGPIPVRKLSDMVKFEEARFTTAGLGRQPDDTEMSIATLLRKLAHDLRYSMPSDERLSKNYEYIVFADDLDDILGSLRNVSWPITDRTIVLVLHERLIEADNQLARFMIAHGRAL